MKKIVVLGSLNMDLVTNVHKTPKVGETVLGNGFSEIPGGKGANQAVAIGRLGGQVSMLGRVGEDDFGKKLKAALKESGVDGEGVLYVKNAPTGTALIMVNDDGDNSIVVIPGANFSMRPENVLSGDFEGKDILLGQLETPIDTIEAAFSKAKEMGLMTVLNTAPAQVLSPELISNVDVLVPNETEFEILTGQSAETEEGLAKGSKHLFDQGVKELIITLGKDGAVYLNHQGKKHHISGYEVEAVDTTAAGDSFIGGLLTALSKGDDIEEAMAFAMKVGAVTVTKHGAQSSLPTLEEIERFKGVKRK
jgi:ribokinase